MIEISGNHVLGSGREPYPYIRRDDEDHRQTTITPTEPWPEVVPDPPPREPPDEDR